LGDVVHSGDQLRTGEDGGLEVRFASGNSLQMMSGVRLTVLVTKKLDEMNIFQRILLEAGKIITRVKEVTGRSSRFEVKTPSAVAAARGTVFRVGLDEEETTRTETLKGQIGGEAQAVMELVREASIRPEEATEFKGEIRDGNCFLIAQFVDVDGLEGPGTAIFSI